MTANRGPQIRAAQAWAGLDDDEMARRIGVSKRTLSRLKGGAELSYERQQAIVEATDVPAWFLESGFDGATGPDEPSLSEHVEALEHRVATAERTAGEITELREAIRALSTDSLRHTRELAELRGRGRRGESSEGSDQ